MKITVVEGVDEKHVIDKYFIECWDEYHFDYKEYYKKHPY